MPEKRNKGASQRLENSRDFVYPFPPEDIFNAIPMPVFVKDRQHRWIIFNEALCTLQGRKREELLNGTDYDFFSKEQADQFWEEEETLFNTRRELYVEVFSVRNGVDTYVLIKKTIVTNAQNEDYLVGCCIDITKRRAAELALVESERRFRSLVQYSPDIIMILEEDHTIRYITPSFFRTFGYEEGEVIGHSIFEFLHEEAIEHVKEKITTILAAPETGASAEFSVRKANGEWIILESFFKNLLSYPAVSGIVINSSDITELRNQANEIQRMNLLLEQDNTKLKVDLKNEEKARVNLKAVDLEGFKKIYPDDDACLQYLAELKWQEGYACKKCGNERYSKGKVTYGRRCTVCGYDESPVIDTIFYRVKFSIIKAFYMVFLISTQRKITAHNLSLLLSLRKDTCAVFKRKLLNVLKSKKNANKLIAGWEGLLLVPVKKINKASGTTS